MNTNTKDLEIKRLRSELEKSEASRKKLREHLELFKEKALNTAELIKQFQQLKKQKEEQDESIVASKAEVEKLRKQLSEARTLNEPAVDGKKEIEKLKIQLLEMRALYESADSERKEAQWKYQELQVDLTRIQSAHHSIQEECAYAIEGRDAAESEVVLLREKVSKLQSQVDELTEAFKVSKDSGRLPKQAELSHLKGPKHMLQTTEDIKKRTDQPFHANVMDDIHGLHGAQSQHSRELKKLRQQVAQYQQQTSDVVSELQHWKAALAPLASLVLSSGSADHSSQTDARQGKGQNRQDAKLPTAAFAASLSPEPEANVKRANHILPASLRPSDLHLRVATPSLTGFNEGGKRQRVSSPSGYYDEQPSCRPGLSSSWNTSFAPRMPANNGHRKRRKLTSVHELLRPLMTAQKPLSDEAVSIVASSAYDAITASACPSEVMATGLVTAILGCASSQPLAANPWQSQVAALPWISPGARTNGTIANLVAVVDYIDRSFSSGPAGECQVHFEKVAGEGGGNKPAFGLIVLEELLNMVPSGIRNVLHDLAKGPSHSSLERRETHEDLYLSELCTVIHVSGLFAQSYNAIGPCQSMLFDTAWSIVFLRNSGKMDLAHAKLCQSNLKLFPLSDAMASPEWTKAAEVLQIAGQGSKEVAASHDMDFLATGPVFAATQGDEFGVIARVTKLLSSAALECHKAMMRGLHPLDAASDPLGAALSAVLNVLPHLPLQGSPVNLQQLHPLFSVASEVLGAVTWASSQEQPVTLGVPSIRLASAACRQPDITETLPRPSGQWPARARDYDKCGLTEQGTLDAPSALLEYMERAEKALMLLACCMPWQLAYERVVQPLFASLPSIPSANLPPLLKLVCGVWSRRLLTPSSESAPALFLTASLCALSLDLLLPSEKGYVSGSSAPLLLALDAVCGCLLAAMSNSSSSCKNSGLSAKEHVTVLQCCERLQHWAKLVHGEIRIPNGMEALCIVLGAGS